MHVSIKKTEKSLAVISDYNADFVKSARKLGGKWRNGAWHFDSRDESRVKDLCIEIYGSDGSDTGELVTIQATLKDDYCSGDKEILCGPVQVARVFDRDGGAQVKDGVIILDGSVGSGGSRKNPACCASENLKIEIRDIPRGTAELCFEDSDWTVKLMDVQIDRDALTEEKARLEARIEEIKSLLGDDK